MTEQKYLREADIERIAEQAANIFLLWDASNNNPNNAITAGVGSMVIELDGTVWSKTSGTGNTGWTQL